MDYYDIIPRFPQPIGHMLKCNLSPGSSRSPCMRDLKRQAAFAVSEWYSLFLITGK